MVHPPSVAHHKFSLCSLPLPTFLPLARPPCVTSCRPPSLCPRLAKVSACPHSRPAAKAPGSARDQRSVGPSCSLAWAPRVSSGKWRLVSSISAGLSSDCVHLGAGSSSNLSSCQAECSSDARCNTINLFPGVAGAVTGACYFKACDATTGDIKLNANDGGWDVYTWLSGPILLHPSANLPAPRPSVSPSMERREGTARLPRCLATSVPAPSPTLPPCLVALHRSVPVRMVLVISI